MDRQIDNFVNARDLALRVECSRTMRKGQSSYDKSTEKLPLVDRTAMQVLEMWHLSPICILSYQSQRFTSSAPEVLHFNLRRRAVIMHCSKCLKPISLAANTWSSWIAATPSHCRQPALTGSIKLDFRRAPLITPFVHAHLRSEPTQDSGRWSHITPFSASQPYPKEICGSNSRSLTASSFL